MPKKRSHGDGALYYLGPSKKLWRGVASYVDPDTNKRRQKYVHSKSQKVCGDKLKELLREIEDYGIPLDKSTTVEVWAQEWLTEHKKPKVDPKTYTGYVSAVKQWIIPAVGDKRVAALRPSDIRAIHARVRNAGKSSTTALHAHRVISMMLDAAVPEGLCAQNIAKHVEPPTKAASDRGAIDTEVAKEMLRIAASQDRGTMWWFKLLGGPRQSEILGATLDGLDLEKGLYRVNWSLEEVPKDHGCGSAGSAGYPCGKKQGAACPQWKWRVPDGFKMRHLFGRWCLTRPKSQTGRVVPLIEPLRLAIAAYLERHADTPNPHGLIWRKADGSPYLPKEDAQDFRDLLFEAGLITAEQNAPGKSPIDGHWGRHTTITLLASLGVDTQLIGEIVGHATEEMTGAYRHAHAEEKAAAMSKLGDLLLGAVIPLEIDAGR